MIKLQGLEDSFILMVTYIRAIGRQISHLVMVNTIIWMVQAIKVNGMKINNTDWEWRYGLMEQNMKANINMAKRKEKANLIGLMDRHMKAISKIIIFMDMAFINGRMEEWYLIKLIKLKYKG